MNSVVLTDEQGSPTGTAEIVEAHTGEGKLHKAFSVYVFRNDGNEILMQQRSAGKMLFPLHWANTCCSHPRESEDIRAAAERRLQEECGFTCPLKEIDSFIYKAEDPEGRGIEYEHDTVLRGDVEDVELNPDPKEIAALEWVPTNQVLRDIETRPEKYGPWFKQGLSLILDHGN